MQRTGRSACLLVTLCIGIAGLWIGCREDLPDLPTAVTADKARGENITAEQDTFPVAWDTWTAKTSQGSCSGQTCDNSKFGFRSDCEDLVLARYDASSCGRTYVALDFNTANLPDCALITAVTIRLYVRAIDEIETGSPPDSIQCGQELFGSVSSASMQLGIYWGTAETAGQGSTEVEWVATDQCFEPSGQLNAEVGVDLGTVLAGTWVDVSLDNYAYANTRGITRYRLDLELVPDGVFRAFAFNSKDASTNRPYLLVTHTSPPDDYSPCSIDGEIAHGSTNCESCASGDFSSNTSASTAHVSRDSSQEGLCGEKRVVLPFNTTDLPDASSLGCRVLRFNVRQINSLDVSTQRIRVYLGLGRLTACPTSLGPVDFVGCGGTYYNCGTITVTGTGAYALTLPGWATIQQNWITEFVLADASSFTSGDGYVDFAIWTVDAPTEANRPKLEVN